MSAETTRFADLPAAERARLVDELLGPPNERRYPPEESHRRGQEIYHRVVRPTLRPEDDGKFVVLDIDTEQFEIDADEFAAWHRLRRRIPTPQCWTERIGYILVPRPGFAWRRA